MKGRSSKIRTFIVFFFALLLSGFLVGAPTSPRRSPAFLAGGISQNRAVVLGPNRKRPWNGSSPFGKPRKPRITKAACPPRMAAISRPARSLLPGGEIIGHYLACKTGDRVLYLPAGAPDSVFTRRRHTRERAGSGATTPPPAENPEPKPFPLRLEGSAEKELVQSEESSQAQAFPIPTTSAWITAIRRGGPGPQDGRPAVLYQPAGRRGGRLRSSRLQRRSPSRKPLLPGRRSSPRRIRIHDRRIGAERPGLPARGQGLRHPRFHFSHPAGPRLQRLRLADPVGRLALRRIGRPQAHQGPDLESHLRLRRGRSRPRSQRRDGLPVPPPQGQRHGGHRRSQPPRRRLEARGRGRLQPL